MLISQSPDKTIQHHNDLGVEVIETDYDAQVLRNGVWYYIDTQTGELGKQVEVN